MKFGRAGLYLGALAIILLLGLSASFWFFQQVRIMRGELEAAQAAVSRLDSRVEGAEKAIQGIRAEQDRTTGELEQHVLVMEGLEKQMRLLQQRLEALERALQQHIRQHPAPQLG